MLSQRDCSSRWLLTFALSLVASLAFATATKAQDTVTGAFEGRITNSRTGAPIAGASIQFINQSTGVPIAKRTDSDGRFYQPLLQPGTYTIRASAPGYKTAEVERRLLATQSNRVIPVPITLEPEVTAATTTTTTTTEPTTTTTTTGTTTTGTTGTTTTVTAQRSEEEASLEATINQTDARRSGAFTELEVSTLPLGATTLVRSFDELALLLPGVYLPPQTGAVVAGPGVGPGVGSAGQFSVNGLRSRSNNFTVDGSDNNDEDIGVRRQGFLALVPQPIESIREYQVITLLAPAQFGRNIGAQVNAISKSGTSGTHGTIFSFFNSSQLNARNFFDSVGPNTLTQLRSATGQPVILGPQPGTCNFGTGAGCNPLLVRNQNGDEESLTLFQGGLVLGGPLDVDRGPGKPPRMFYFLSAEGQILNSVREANFAVPTLEERGAFRSGASGLFNNLSPGFFGGADFAFPTTLQGDAVFSLFPFPNNPTGVYGANTLTRTLPASGQGKIISGKFDANGKFKGREQSFTGRYNFTDDWRDIPVTGGAIFSSLRPRVRTQNFSSFLNSELSDPSSTKPLFNQLRFSYGRTRLIFDELRDREFLLPSIQLPNEPFLLNAPIIINNTLPNNLGVANTGPVIYGRGGTTECGTSFFCPGLIGDGAIGPIGQVNIAGFSPVGTDVFNFPQRRVNNTFQLADTVSWRLGKHSIVFGADTRRTELNSDLPRNARTLLTFNGAPRVVFDFNPGTGDISNFRFNGLIRPTDLVAAGAASGDFLTLATQSSGINLRYYQLDFFAQDEWRIRPNFSLSYGLRYEYNSPPSEINNKIESTFNSSSLSLIPAVQTFIGGRTGIFDPDRNNFAPRVGFAWSPKWFGADQTTVIRAGYGLFYDQILGAVVSQSRNVFPNFLTLNTTGGLNLASAGVDVLNIFNPASANNGINLGGGGGFVSFTAPGTANRLNPGLSVPVLINVFRTSFPQGGFSFTLPAKELQTPMAHQYSVTFEQQLSRNFVFSASYVGTLGRNLLHQTTPNLGPNAITFFLFADTSGAVPEFIGGSLQPGSRVSSDFTITGGRPRGGAGAVTIYTTDARSRYDALQLQARGRFHDALQYQINYTFSSVKDDASDVFDLAGAPALPQNSGTFAGEYAPANFDARHRLSYNFIWDMPYLKNRDRSNFARVLFGDIQVAGTGKFQTGQPFTVNSIFDVNLDGNLTDRLNSTSGIQETGDRRQPLVLTTGPLTLLAPIGQDGSVPRNSFRAGNVLELDLAVVKRFVFSETKDLTFRMDVFNFINRANYGIPVRFVEAAGFGQATDTITPGRRIQFAVKYNF